MISANLNNTERKAIYRREGFACALCNDNRDLQIHHYLKRSQGGSDHPHNLVCLCAKCHKVAHGFQGIEGYEDISCEDIEQAVVEYLADLYASEVWNPWRKGG